MGGCGEREDGGSSRGGWGVADEDRMAILGRRIGGKRYWVKMGV